jgi:hypothetical protein
MSSETYIRCDRCRLVTKAEELEGWGLVRKMSYSDIYKDITAKQEYHICPLCSHNLEGYMRGHAVGGAPLLSAEDRTAPKEPS